MTSAFTPTFGAAIWDVNNLQIPVFGDSAGFVWQEQTTRTDGPNTPIDFLISSKSHDGGTPDIEKFWDQPTLISKIQPAAGNLTITPKTGGLDAVAQAPIQVDSTLGRQRLPRLGTGRFAQLTYEENTVGQDVILYGIELPFSELGRR